MRIFFFVLLVSFLAADVSARGAPTLDETCAGFPVYEAGRVIRQACVDREQGLTVVDLSDEWAPAIFSETPDRPQPYRRTFVTLANEQMGESREWDTARRDRYFELYGIFPSMKIVRRRLLDESRHVCHALVDDGPLRSMKAKVLAPTAKPNAPVVTAILTTLQRHLACEGLLDPRAASGVFDELTQVGLRTYQRRHMLPSPGLVDAETREILLTNSRELDFRTLLRALRERVVDATGLIEDGSALNAWEPVLGRFIESAEYRRAMGPRPLARGAPDLIDRATEAAAVALGWTTPESAAPTRGAAPTGRVALRLPPPPAYHSRSIALRAEIDRGDVWTSYPFDAEGRRRPSPAKNRPTFTLYVQTEEGEVALVRWPTTIGAWKSELVDEVETLRYKASPTGRFYWRDLVAAPAWFPPPTTPDRELLRRGPDGRWQADQDAVGPGYRSAYGLVALFHHRAVATSGGTTDSADVGIRTHGSGNYRSILRGSSHGCHRLFNHLAVRLGSFVLAHTAHARHGIIEQRYGHLIAWKGRTIRLRAESRGYRYELLPPIPVDVLPGRSVRSRSTPVAPGQERSPTRQPTGTPSGIPQT